MARHGSNSFKLQAQQRDRAVSKAPKKGVRKRKPTLRAALEAAQKAGKTVKSAVVENDRITLQFGESTAADANDDWDKKLEELERGKH
jgi:hypothetical protein